MRRTGSRQAWASKAQRAEALGYATLLVPDHFDAELAPFTALQAAADATSSLRLGTFVCNNDFRHPAVLAKEAAGLDLLSGGRLELGIGAGWMRSEYEQAGIPFDVPGLRVKRLAEAVALIKGALSNDEVTFRGENYSPRKFVGLPKAIQQPHPPLLIGGGGKKVLELAAQEAQIVSINPRGLRDGSGLDPTDLLDAAMVRKVGWIREKANGRDSAMELNILISAVDITADRRSAVGQLSTRLGVSEADIPKVPYVLVGSPAQIAETLRERRDIYGLSYVCIFEEGMDDFGKVIAKVL